MQVPRGLHEAKEVVTKRVITFVDASLQAYRTVVYLQCVYNDATISSRLVASKCKVAPLKPMTVPWLELAGAVLGLRLAQHLMLVLELTHAICNILFRQHGCVVVDSGSWAELSSLCC